ncbi:DUF1365 domain-containing protein [Thermodesulfobacteriota bacterium]
MKSCIYEGTIRHRRFRPVQNAFQYRLYLMYLDLDELPQVIDMHPFYANERLNLATFRRRDHLGNPAVQLKQAVHESIRTATAAPASGPVRILTHLRYFGFCFNPASFYYCYNSDDTKLETIVVEIHNTPWGEEFPYVLGQELNAHPSADWRQYHFKKNFHVSPFMDMNLTYDWRFRVPGEALTVHMLLSNSGDSRLFDVSLVLKRRAINRQALTRVLVTYPLMTLKVTAMIYWQALRLLQKGAPFYQHPQNRSIRIRKQL